MSPLSSNMQKHWCHLLVYFPFWPLKKLLIDRVYQLNNNPYGPTLYSRDLHLPMTTAGILILQLGAPGLGAFDLVLKGVEKILFLDILYDSGLCRHCR